MILRHNKENKAVSKKTSCKTANSYKKGALISGVIPKCSIALFIFSYYVVRLTQIIFMENELGFNRVFSMEVTATSLAIFALMIICWGNFPSKRLSTPSHNIALSLLFCLAGSVFFHFVKTYLLGLSVFLVGGSLFVISSQQQLLAISDKTSEQQKNSRVFQLSMNAGAIFAISIHGLHGVTPSSLFSLSILSISMLLLISIFTIMKSTEEPLAVRNYWTLISLIFFSALSYFLLLYGKEMVRGLVLTGVVSSLSILLLRSSKKRQSNITFVSVLLTSLLVYWITQTLIYSTLISFFKSHSEISLLWGSFDFSEILIVEPLSNIAIGLILLKFSSSLNLKNHSMLLISLLCITITLALISFGASQESPLLFICLGLVFFGSAEFILMSTFRATIAAVYRTIAERQLPIALQTGLKALGAISAYYITAFSSTDYLHVAQSLHLNNVSLAFFTTLILSVASMIIFLIHTRKRLIQL